MAILPLLLGYTIIRYRERRGQLESYTIIRYRPGQRRGPDSRLPLLQATLSSGTDRGSGEGQTPDYHCYRLHYHLVQTRAAERARL